MAKKNTSADLSVNSTNTFIKGMNKDSDPSFITEGSWIHARNAVNNTEEGDVGSLSNEPSNTFCIQTGLNLPGSKKIIGTIHLFSDNWLIYTAATDVVGGEYRSVGSEIGLFQESRCKYKVIVEDTCLNFSDLHLITGASREKEDCTWEAYWSDGNNPDRAMNIGDPKTWFDDTYIYQNNNFYLSPSGQQVLWPGVRWVEDCVEVNDCITCTQLNQLDCEKIRLARLMQSPCLHVSAGQAGGSLRNGSYFATIAYSIKGQQVTNWFSPSNVQPIWYEQEPFGAIEIDIEADIENFDEFILCVVSNINQGAVAKRIGVYSTSTTKIYLDQIKEDLPSIPIELLPIQNPVYEKSDQIVEVNNYLLRVGPTTKFDFNYQPLANLIRSRWVSVQYPADYYIKNGYKPSYLRDETYAFFIRWVYDTGDKSSSYHIPGRARRSITQCGANVFEDADFSFNQNSIYDSEKVFEVYNTAGFDNSTGVVGTTLEDGGLIVGTGFMGYHESSEVYPDKQPEIWNSSSHCWTGTADPQYDLCGKPIRHHKFPEHSTHPSVQHYATINNQTFIRILGVEFDNIIYPKDNEGNDIPGIVGYEILRGSREGNKTIIAKGMINNMRPYNIVGQAGTSNKIGLYPNHPFNTVTTSNLISPASGNLNAGDDPYIQGITIDSNTLLGQTINPFSFSQNAIPRDIITFHSPDTNFRNPWLSAGEFKTYGILRGNSLQYFIEPDKHPQHKLIKDIAVLAMIIGGVIEAVIASVGKRTINQPSPSYTRKFGPDIYGGASAIYTQTTEYTGPLESNSWYFLNKQLGFDVDQLLYFNVQQGALGEVLGLGNYQTAYENFNENGGMTDGGTYIGQSYINEWSKTKYLEGSALSLFAGVQNFLYYFSEGADLTLQVIYALVPNRQYALQMLAHGFYNQWDSTVQCNINRYQIEDSFYLKDVIQETKPYDNQIYNINNLKRQKSVVLKTNRKFAGNKGPAFITAFRDNSLVTLGTSGLSGDIFDKDSKSTPFSKRLASYYGAIKLRLRNQYGQLDSVKQIPVTPCEFKFNYRTLPEINVQAPGCVQVAQKYVGKTEILFNGDTYINRYTEKNNMLFFYDWLYGQPNGTEFNYFTRQVIPQPRFWMNSERYEVSNLFQDGVQGWVDLLTGSSTTGSGPLPSNLYKLDSTQFTYPNTLPGFGLGSVNSYPGFFGVKESYFYLGTSSIRDFFVESEVIVDFREQGDQPFQRHYDPYRYTNLEQLLNINPEWITRGNYYAYDYSLSISKLFTQYFSQGNLQSRYYDPNVASLCYTYYPDRIIYSLPQDIEAVKDNWFVYLANNYKEFKDQISGVKNFAKTGIFITFKNSSPLVLQGVDELQTDLGTKITVGDGGLFARQPQNVVVADQPYEYGSSQNRLSVISTPAGMYYMSQNQGKIFSYSQGLQEISQAGLKWWFNLFLPYKLTDDFPNYPHTDNPVGGIGCHASYDNKNTMLYFSKKDYQLKPEYTGRVVYDEVKNKFILDNFTELEVGNSIIFDDASWTMSFDPKAKYWVSYHDWKPDLFVPTKNSFLTSKFNTLWKHNDTCQSYCNYYGVNYPFEVEIPIVTGQTVTTMRSMEYILESYRRSINCVDQYHVLDFNFDYAIVYNTEQVSGLLHLNPYPKNNVALSIQYPQLNLNQYEILYSKEEQKYRFNQFWDITDDRGEFPVGSYAPTTAPVIPGTTELDGPSVERTIWLTDPNGYTKTLNPLNLNYTKDPLQRKKFRHYVNFLHLRRDISGSTNMIFKILNSKKTYSPR
jgi:hypothetical protein